MQDNIWLRLITVGLVLAALAIGYFLLSGRLTSKQTGSTASPEPTILGQDAKSTPSPSPSPNSTSAYDKIVERNQSNVRTLPNTGFPAFLALVFSVSAIISGWSLRKFPH